MELFGNASGEFFHFVFVPKSLVYVLLGVVFMSCPHSVLERVEFAEGDCFLCSPDANHHIESFDIVGSVVLRVIHLFHIPYQIYSAKIEKTLRISQRGGMDNKSNLFANNMSKKVIANIVNMCVKTKSLPEMLRRRAYNLGGIVEEILQFHIEIYPTKAKTML